MSNVEKLLGLFDSGRLVRPTADKLNSMDLFRALARLAGANGIQGGEGVDELVRLIGPAKHYVFILVDGLGMNFLESLPEKSFLRSTVALELLAIFPPTTAAVLTSLATTQWPCFHAMPGWFVYLDTIDKTTVPLPFIERFTERPLEKFGLTAENVFPVPSVWPRTQHNPLTVIKADIADSTYSRYCSGNTTHIGYRGIGHALWIVRDRIARTDAPTFTYLYLPQLDATSHEKGTRHPDTLRFVEVLDKMLGSLCRDIAGKARIIITADHGLLDTPEEQKLLLHEGDKLLKYLLCPPTVEPRVPAFHVKKGRESEFARYFSENYGEHFLLITPEEAESLHLFGPGPLSPLIRRRLGTFIGIPASHAAMHYRAPGDNKPPFAAVHAGLSSEEMRVPLILA